MALRGYVVEEVALDCAEGLVGRREALRRLGLLGLTSAAAAAVLAVCGADDDSAERTGTGAAAPATSAGASSASVAPSTATSGQGSPPSPSAGEEVRFAGPAGELLGVVATAPDPSGAVLVIHENRGLTPHIRTIPGRLADDGYTALAIDLLSRGRRYGQHAVEGDATAGWATPRPRS